MLSTPWPFWTIKTLFLELIWLYHVTQNSNQITKFIFTKSDNLPSLSSGYTWCGANEVASHPKTPTLEKAAALDKGLSEPSLAPALVEEEEFPTRSRVAALKQMSVASIASLRQRLSESRKIFDRKISQHTVSYFFLAQKSSTKKINEQK